MLREGMDGFCMALADSVPGVSGGTVAFIMGFYNRFIGSVHDLAFGKLQEKRTALVYLAKLGVGWVIGMAIAAVVLSASFESHIYAVSSLFIGFIAGAIPLIIKAEKASLRQLGRGALFGVLGILLVAGITWANGKIGGAAIDLGQFSPGLAAKLVILGLAAISAMFLPGISGSTLLLVFGAYIPVITAIKGVITLDFSYIPCLLIFACSILVGAATAAKAIKVGFEKFRPQAVYLILGMMIGSFYAIIMGPTTLEIPQAALSWGNFQIPAALAGVALVLGMELLKARKWRHCSYAKQGKERL